MSVAPDTGPTPPAARVDATALPAGHTMCEYRIEKMLGGGGFGITYLAYDINLELPVAIKEYFPADLTVRSPDRGIEQIKSTLHVSLPSQLDSLAEKIRDWAKKINKDNDPRWPPQTAPLINRGLLFKQAEPLLLLHRKLKLLAPNSGMEFLKF